VIEIIQRFAACRWIASEIGICCCCGNVRIALSLKVHLFPRMKAIASRRVQGFGQAQVAVVPCPRIDIEICCKRDYALHMFQALGHENSERAAAAVAD
jgi:hypothetical protein